MFTQILLMIANATNLTKKIDQIMVIVPGVWLLFRNVTTEKMYYFYALFLTGSSTKRTHWQFDYAFKKKSKPSHQ